MGKQVLCIGGLLLLFLVISYGSPQNETTIGSEEEFQLLVSSRKHDDQESHTTQGGKSTRKKRQPFIGFTVPLVREKECYVSPKLTFGSSREDKFRVKFDSTLDTLMVFDEKLAENKLFVASSKSSKVTTKFYDLAHDSASDNAKEYSGPFTETYPDQSVMSGEWIQDTVKLHRKCATTLELGLVTEIRGEENGGEADAYISAQSTDAIMGLGFARVQQGGTPIVPPALRILERNPSFDTRVSFYISTRGDEGSHVSFGSPQSGLVKGGSDEIIYHDIPRGSSKWELDLHQVEYYDVNAPLNFERLTASIETSSPVVTLPTKLYNQIIRDTNAEEFDGDIPSGRKAVHYTPCDNIDGHISSIRFDIGSGAKKREYTLDIVDLAVEEQPPGGSIEEGEVVVKMCKLQIEDSGSNDDGGRVGLGHPFLQKYYTIFHYLTIEAMVDSLGGEGEPPTPGIGLGPSKEYAKWKHAFRHNTGITQAENYREEEKETGGKKSWGKDIPFPKGQMMNKKENYREEKETGGKKSWGKDIPFPKGQMINKKEKRGK